MNYFVAICAFIFLAVMLFIDVVILFVGEEFRAGAPVIPILLMANLFLGIFYNLSVWFKISGKTLYGALIAVIGMIITIVLNFLLIPRMGYMGAAWATFICYGAMMLLSYFAGRKFYPVPYNVLRISAYLILAVLLYYLGNTLKADSQIIQFLYRSLLMAVYILVFLMIEKPGIFRRNASK